MKRTIFREERLQMIMNMIVEQKKVYVNDLAERFGRSTTSIRTDLMELESRGLIVRTHGGAILPEKNEKEFVLDKNILKFREELYAAEKNRISKATMDLIQDGDSVLIDGGKHHIFCCSRTQEQTRIDHHHNLVLYCVNIIADPGCEDLSGGGTAASRIRGYDR